MPDVARQTDKGIQASVVGPEIPLLHLYTCLTQEKGLRCDLWPKVDAYDLLVHLSESQSWPIDMKDYSRATSLAVALSGREFPVTSIWNPSHGPAFYLFPDHRKQTGYKRAFLSLWVPPEGQRIEVLYVEEFLRRIERVMERKERGDHAPVE
jgi:hypothetical protein